MKSNNFTNRLTGGLVIILLTSSIIISPITVSPFFLFTAFGDSDSTLVTYSNSTTYYISEEQQAKFDSGFYELVTEKINILQQLQASGNVTDSDIYHNVILIINKTSSGGNMTQVTEERKH